VIAVAEAPVRDSSYSFLPRKGGVVVNPFDDPDASYLAPVDDEGQHSLWPSSPTSPRPCGRCSAKPDARNP
jgi:hypothetical protein